MEPKEVDLESAILDLVARKKVKLPPYPSVALKLGELVRGGRYGLPDVSAVVSSDQALAADVLRCANSAYYGRGEVSSLSAAVQRVGAQEVVRLALVSGLAGAGRAPSALQPLKAQLWQNGIASAVISQVLARNRRLDPDHAFLCGLLHDFGWAIGLSCLEELWPRHPELAARPPESWPLLLQSIHVKLGLALAEQWQLPDLVSQVIAQHHRLGGGEGPHGELIDAVAASDVVVELLGSRPSVSQEELADIPSLSDQDCALLARALPDLPAIVQAFERESKPAPVAKAAPPAAPPPDRGFHPVSLTLQLIRPPRKGTLAVSGVSRNAWLMESPDPLAESQLLEAELSVPGAPLRLWAKAIACDRQGAGYRIECRPFALNSEQATRWKGLVVPAAAPPQA